MGSQEKILPKNSESGYLQFMIRPELIPTNCKLYRAYKGKYFSYV